MFSITYPPIVKCLRYWKDKYSACITRVTGYWALYRLTITSIYLLLKENTVGSVCSSQVFTMRQEFQIVLFFNWLWHKRWGMKYMMYGIFIKRKHILPQLTPAAVSECSGNFMKTWNLVHAYFSYTDYRWTTISHKRHCCPGEIDYTGDKRLNSMPWRLVASTVTFLNLKFLMFSSTQFDLAQLSSVCFEMNANDSMLAMMALVFSSNSVIKLKCLWIHKLLTACRFLL